MSADTSHKRISERLDGVLRRYYLLGIAEAFCAAVAAGGALFLVFGLAEAFLYLSPAVKAPLLFTVALSFFIVPASILTIRVLRRPDPDERARIVERAYPAFNDRLISAVQLGRLREGELHGQSQSLIDALLVRVESETAAVDPRVCLPSRKLHLTARTAYAVTAAVLVLVLILPPNRAGGFYRLLDYDRAYVSPDTVSVFVLAGDDTIIRGEDFSTPGFLSGWRFEPVNIYYRWDDSQSWSLKPVDVDDKTGNFTAVVEKPRVSFSYYIEAGSVTTPRHRVTVIERPVVEKIEFTLSYPRYTGLGVVEKRDNDGNIRALSGTEVAMTVRANKPLASMTVNWSDSTETACGIEGLVGATTFTVDRTVDYHIALVDTLGIENANPIEYRVTALVDEPPRVTIASPAAEITLPLSMAFPIVYRAGDDYGLTSARLRYRLPYDDGDRETVLKQGGMGADFEDSFLWNMGDLGLLPDDTVTFHIAVFDNDTVNGPKIGLSDTVTVRVPSMTDLLSDMNETQEAGIDKLREMSRKTSEKDASLEEVRRNIISGKELDWSDKNALQEAAKDMERMREELTDVSEALKRAADRLSEEDMAAIETLEKYRKIADLMDEIAEGDMKEALKRLTQANINLDPHSLKKAIDENKVTAEDIKKKLDRIISLLEQAKAIQRFETAKRLLEELAFEQAELTEKYGENARDPALWREQSRIASEMESLESELRDMAEELAEKFGMETGDLENFMESAKPAETMREAAKNMQEGREESAGKNLDDANAMLSEMLNMLDRMGSSMKQRNTAELRRRLMKSLVELLAVSEKQENLITALGNGELPEGDRDLLARRQLEVIDALSKSRKSLESFGELVADVSAVIDQMMAFVAMSMESAVDAFATGKSSVGAATGRKALGDLNRSIHILTMFLSQDDGSGMGMPGDLMQQLQMIANGQLSLRMQLGDGLTEEMMMQLAAEQQKLAEMLSQLNDNLMSDRRLHEMLEKAVGDMDDTAAMMRRNEPRERIERKQFDIYRRLLDARRSRREKDESEERKSFTAQKNESLGADSLADDLGEKKRELNELLKQAMSDDIDPEYLRLIRRYFESMLHDFDIMGSLGERRAAP